MPDDPKIWAALVTGGLALIGTIYTGIMNYWSRTEQDRFKTETDRQLASLNAKLQAEREERLAHLEASIRKIERLEASRSAGYEEIWNLTGSLNLFGPTTEPDIKDLSTRLKDWYYKHGLVLRKDSDSKERYFLVQEILNFGMLQSASFRRPADDRLFDGTKRPIEVLRDLRSQYLGITDHGGEVEKLQRYVSTWKEKNNKRKEQAEENWVLLQFVLSKFRSGLIKDLGFDVEDVQDTE